MCIRRIDKQENEKIVALIEEVFLEFIAPTLSNQGIESFYNIISNKKFMNSLDTFGYFIDDKLQGLISMNNNMKHISFFFVRKEFKNSGIGKKLWEYVKSNTKNEIITVKSSPYAIKIYKKLGFYETDKEQIKDGIIYTPMQFSKFRNLDKND